MLLPTIPAPITTTLACVGRLLTGIPSYIFVAGSQHSDEDESRKGLRSANAGQPLLHIGAEESNPEPADKQADKHAARSLARPHDGDVYLGASRRGRLKPVAPLTAGCPGVGFDGGHGDLASGGIPFVTVAFPGKGVAFGDLGPAGALTVDAKVCVVDPRPDLRPAIAEVGQGAEDPVRRHVGGQPKADGW